MKGKAVSLQNKLILAMSGLFLLAYGLSVLLIAHNFYAQGLVAEANILARENALQADKFVEVVKSSTLTLRVKATDDEAAKQLVRSPRATRIGLYLDNEETIQPYVTQTRSPHQQAADRELFVQLDYLLKQSGLQMVRLRCPAAEQLDETRSAWTAYHPPGDGKSLEVAEMWLLKAGPSDSLKAWQLLQVEDRYFYFETTRPLSHLQDQLRNLLLSFLGYALPLLALVVILALALARHLTKDLKQLTQASESYAKSQELNPLTLTGSRETQLLGQAFNQMAAELKAQRQALLQENERQDHFIQALNHEYKTPLASMLLHLSLLKEAELSPAARERSLAYLWEAASHLDSIRERLMQLFFDPANLNSESIDLAHFLPEFVEEVTSLYTERGCSLQLDLRDPGLVEANPTLLKQILSNLLDNACEAVQELEPEKRLITLRADQDSLSVFDPGPGLAPEELSQLKTYFYRGAGQAYAQEPGQHLGLGLALVDKICHYYGWKLEFSSQQKEGFTATIRLT